MSQRKFGLGDRVRLRTDETSIIKMHPDQALIVFEVVRLLPEERDGDPQYCIKSEAEPHMRLAAQSQLAAV